MARNFVVGVFVLLALTGWSNCLQRTLEYAFNEDCHELCKNSNVRLGHVKAIGPNDTLHYLWDFTESPTIFIAVTSPTAKLQVSWCDYIARKPNSLNFTEKPIYTFGVSIERLLEFDDINDEGRIDKVNNKNITELKLRNFQWHYRNLTKHNNFVEFYTLANNYKDPDSNETRRGNITFVMHGFSTLNHSHVMPCMLHSENSTQIDIVIDHLETKKGFSRSRFAIELLIVSETNPNETLAIDKKRKLDDEFTPGIFEIMELSTPVINEKSAYLQWRPVSYTNAIRDVTDSVNTVYYAVKNATVDNYFAKSNLLYMYYGENMFNILVQRVNISLGDSGDPFYKETQYSTWTFIVGYGTPPNERFSSIVILVISIGVGLPLLILMITGIYVCVRRRPQHTDNETDNR